MILYAKRSTSEINDLITGGSERGLRRPIGGVYKVDRERLSCRCMSINCS
ncbi:hypothetical protein ZOSMA_47G00040 [Zostera marina]|uniref:Uncharacterized protein n=1 Tax=Zostera marina TaxID=29655 RepID=A0A0K9P1Y6_ZOSMR|nr:hypothetical protein ZOSMA_47G00040 [Zostera marina]